MRIDLREMGSLSDGNEGKARWLSRQRCSVRNSDDQGQSLELR